MGMPAGPSAVLRVALSAAGSADGASLLTPASRLKNSIQARFGSISSPGLMAPDLTASFKVSRC